MLLVDFSLASEISLGDEGPACVLLSCLDGRSFVSEYHLFLVVGCGIVRGGVRIVFDFGGD